MSAMMRGNLRMAIAGVRGAKWRSLLTMLGVIVGIVAVVTVVSIGEGAKRQLGAQLGHFGHDLITVRPTSLNSGQAWTSTASTDVLFGLGAVAGLSLDDVGIVERASGVKLAAPLGVVSGVVKVDGHTYNDQPVIATNGRLPEVLNHGVKYGDFWTPDDEISPTAVIGYDVANDLFKSHAPLGQRLTFRGQEFMVRGVLESFNSPPLSPTARFDDAIFIPYQLAAGLTHNTGGLYAVLAKAGSQDKIPPTVQTITADLKKGHGDQQDFRVLDAKQSSAANAQTVRALTGWTTAVAIVALLIGGVGIMNIMLLSVTERLHEIGVRKAIGASRRQILSQFLMEAVTLSVVGGVIGIAVSLVTVGLLYTYTDLKPIVSWPAIGLAFSVSLIVGIIFGVTPAVKAASQDPIEALRHE